MTREDLAVAAELAETLRKSTRAGSRQHDLAETLCKLLQPPPSAESILLAVPGETHVARAKAIGLSRQGYYNLRNGVSAPSGTVAKLLAQITGMPEEVVRSAWQ